MTEEFRKDLAKQILEYRAKHNLSQVDFAKKCKISQQTACNIENVKQVPSKLTLNKILSIISIN